jgi:hypothetical protein
MPALQICPEPAEIDVASAEDMHRFAGSVGEQAPEQVFTVDQGPASAAADPLGDLDDLPAALVEHDLSCRAAEGNAKRADAGTAKPPQGGVMHRDECTVEITFLHNGLSRGSKWDARAGQRARDAAASSLSVCPSCVKEVSRAPAR